MDIFYPIQKFADLVTFQLFRIAPQSYWGDAVNFFIYDTIKIGLLLIVIGYVMAVTRYYFPMEKVRDMLTRRRLYGLDYFFAAILGVVTPFCSCSSIPLFLGFVGAGIPIGVTFAFLISSPLVNESSLYLFPAMFGLNVALIYNSVGIIIAILGGFVLQKLGVEKFIKPELFKLKSRQQVELEHGGTPLGLKQQLKYFWNDGMAITKEIFPYVLLGVGIGALIHGFVPANLVEQNLSSRQWWTIPVATFIGTPLYANSVSVIPVMEALVGKGVPLGTALAFMTGIVTVSIPQIMILKKVMGEKLLAAFLSVTVVGIMIMGYVFNIIL
jgi:uncharacterized membrane protein YraQ (UPF0718 family)